MPSRAAQAGLASIAESRSASPGSESRIKIEIVLLPRLLYTYSEVAAIFSVSTGCIKELTLRGELREVVLEKRGTRIALDSILDFARRRLGLREIPIPPANETIPELLLTYGKAGEMLCVGECAISSLVKKGRLKAVYVSNRPRLTVESVQTAIARMGDPL